MRLRDFREIKVGGRVRFGKHIGTVVTVGFSYNYFCVGVRWVDSWHQSWFNETYKGLIRRLRVV